MSTHARLRYDILKSVHFLDIRYCQFDCNFFNRIMNWLYYTIRLKHVRSLDVCFYGKSSTSKTSDILVNEHLDMCGYRMEYAQVFVNPASKYA